MALNPGDVVDQKYRIVRLLGEGGMGAVYEGENTRIHRRVAIKVLHATVAESNDAVQRFEREAQAAGRIGSEHIVEVLDLGHLASGDRYMVMEFLEGQSLGERIETRGRLPAQAVAGVAVQLLEGLQAAHDAGIIHRDLKPDNVFLLSSRGGQKDFVKILDFGISKFSTLGGEFSMTRTGAVMGTPYYMSPEQAKGLREIDARVDLYAVGVILYEAVAGEVPFNADSFNELLFKIVLEKPVPLVEKVPELDPAFAAIVEKAMAREAAQRFQSARDLRAALEAWLTGAPVLKEATLAQGTPNLVTGAASTLAGDVEAGARPKQKTQGTWAKSGDFAGAPSRSSSRGVVLAGVAAAVLALSAGGTYLWRSSESNESAQLAALRAEEEKAEAALRAEELRLEAEMARAEAERVRAEKERLEAAAALTAAEQKRLDEERAAAEALAREKEEAARQVRTTSRPARTAPPSPPPAKDPPPASPGTGGGRVIRTDL